MGQIEPVLLNPEDPSHVLMRGTPQKVAATAPPTA